MSIWFTSDQHFCHANVIRFCNRPFANLDEMHATIIKRWQDAIKPQDTVYLLGDVFFCKAQTAAEIAKRLPGKIIFVQGNHDKFSARQYASFGWEVFQEAKVRLLGKYFILSHFPYWPKQDELPQLEPYDLRYQDRRPTNRGSFLLCGHVHEKWKTKDRMINVGVDVWNYAPVSLGMIDRLTQNQTPLKSD